MNGILIEPVLDNGSVTGNSTIRSGDYVHLSADVLNEGERKRELEGRRGVARVRATTVAMQEGKGTLETEAIGEEASQAIEDPGPADSVELGKSISLIDDHIVDPFVNF